MILVNIQKHFVFLFVLVAEFYPMYYSIDYNIVFFAFNSWIGISHCIKMRAQISSKIGEILQDESGFESLCLSFTLGQLNFWFMWFIRVICLSNLTDLSVCRGWIILLHHNHQIGPHHRLRSVVHHEKSVNTHQVVQE